MAISSHVLHLNHSYTHFPKPPFVSDVSQQTWIIFFLQEITVTLSFFSLSHFLQPVFTNFTVTVLKHGRAQAVHSQHLFSFSLYFLHLCSLGNMFTETAWGIQPEVVPSFQRLDLPSKTHPKGDFAYFRPSVLKWPMSSTVQSCILCSWLCTAGRCCLFHICKFKSKSYLLLFILPICSFNYCGIKKPNEQYFKYHL